MKGANGVKKKALALTSMKDWQEVQKFSKTGAHFGSHVVGTPQFGSSYGQQACVTCADSTVTMCSSHVAESGPCSGFGQPRKWYLSATKVFGQQAVRCDSFEAPFDNTLSRAARAEREHRRSRDPSTPAGSTRHR